MKLTDALEGMTRDQQIEALDRWMDWYDRDTTTEWTPEDEADYSMAIYLSVALVVERDGFAEYTPEDLDNYRQAAMVAAADN